MKGALISLFLWWLFVQQAISPEIEKVKNYESLILVESTSSLIFRLENLQFVRDHKNILSTILFLCPAETQTEVEIARDISSMTAKPLFVKVAFPAQEIKYVPTCRHSSDPSVMLNMKKKDDKFYEIGYEIRLVDNHSRVLHPSQTFQTHLKPMREFLRPKPDPDYIWISVLNLRIEPGRSYVQQISHEITNGEYITEETTKECPPFHGIEWLRNFNWDETLRNANEQKIQKVTGYDGEAKLELLKLAPLEDFSSYGKQLAACFYLNKVAIWSSIANGSWQKVEDFVRQIAKEFGRLQITTGTFGEFELNSEPKDSTISWGKKVRQMLRTETQILSLGEGNDKVSVPSVIWKLVQFQYKWQRYGEDVYFAILVLTFNNPFVETSSLHDDCSILVCEKYGWQVGNDDIHQGKTHCCPINTEIIQLLNIKNLPTFFNDFDLDLVRKLVDQRDYITEEDAVNMTEVSEEGVGENSEQVEEITDTQEETEH